MTHSFGKLSEILKWIDTITINNKDCKRISALNFKYEIYDQQICALSKFGTGPCSADFGGPLIVDNVLIGILSWGDIICDAGNPNIYIRVSYFRDWILEKIL